MKPGTPSPAVCLAACSLLLALAGCDGPRESAQEPPPPPPAENQRVVAALGDSITAGSPLWDPNPAVREMIGPALDERSQFEFWATDANPRLEFKNCGVFGERTDQIRDRLGECATGAGALIVQGGINDIAQGRPAESAAADLEAMVAEAKALGLAVAIAEVLPWNNGSPAADEPIRKLNSEIRRIARTADIPLLPFHSALEDPANPGTMGPGLTDDGDHPSVEGYRRLAREAVLPGIDELGLPAG